VLACQNSIDRNSMPRLPGTGRDEANQSPCAQFCAHPLHRGALTLADLLDAAGIASLSVSTMSDSEWTLLAAAAAFGRQAPKLAL